MGLDQAVLIGYQAVGLGGGSPPPGSVNVQSLQLFPKIAGKAENPLFVGIYALLRYAGARPREKRQAARVSPINVRTCAITERVKPSRL
jgi:hypothetical protein